MTKNNMKTFKQHLKEGKTDTISVFDIDDCLLFSKSRIYYTLPGETEQRSASTGEFAEIRSSLPKDTEYDLRDFVEFKSIYAGITQAKPNIPVLKMLDKAIHAGHKIGILTARQNQAAVLAAIKDFLLYKDKNGKLQKLPRTQFRKRWVFAVSDVFTNKALGGGGDVMNPQALKAKVLQDILGDREKFKRIRFFDDDKNNIAAVKALNDPRIETIWVKN